MNWQIDHVVVAGKDLDRLRSVFADAGLEPDYGGKHTNGVTHNCILGFPDGSYLEIIGKRGAGESPWWDRQLEADAGPTAWAIAVDDIDVAMAELTDRGISIENSTRHTRERPDGTPITWEMAIVGDELGTVAPFLIQDHTPRVDRVYPTDRPADTGLEGIAEVVICVTDLEANIDRFQTFFDADHPAISEQTPFGATAARFADAPVSLLEASDDPRLSRRVDTFGACPVAFFFEADGDSDLVTGSSQEWFDASVSFLDIGTDGWYGILKES